MKSFFASIAGAATTLSLFSILNSVSAANITEELSQCGVPKTDENSYWSIVGVQGAGIYPRQELRQLEKDAKTWNLFLLAMAKFQAMSQEDKRSYYKLAAIHGAPFEPWDMVKGEGSMGYCPHGSNLFGPWHRPYLAGFEQVLHEHVVSIADSWKNEKEKREYQTAAMKFRLPYWDSAMDPPNSQEGVLPFSVREERISVNHPDGTTKEIPNPLYSYAFHPLDPEDFSSLNWKTTLRLPVDGKAAVTTSQNGEVNSRVGAQQVNNRDMVYKLLTVYQPFNEWSNKANGGKIGNLETLHDGIHNSFGVGHMGIVEMSAYDPIFWFHHCNVDRLMAIYQHRYPETYVQDSTQARGTFAIPGGSTQGLKSSLPPFHMNAKGDMWTSETIRNWESFGYTYPELMGKPDNDTLTRDINRLYKASTQGLNKNNTLTSREISYAQATNMTADAWDWMAEVNMPSDIRVTYAVRGFLGKPSDNPLDWATDPNYVGQVASLSSPRMDSDITVTANIVLTDKLAEKREAGELESFEQEDVIAYLKKEWYWQIQQVDGASISRMEPPKGLNVTIFSVPVKLPTSDNEVPVWTGAFEYHKDIKGNHIDTNATQTVPGTSTVQQIYTGTYPTGTAV
ncbi:Di-copper centre-containing protein [Lojkania enalia]|uniref:tyrosinase n=1 Tax=Lojkania enalia TaxID=147567 RepID=A0A9P4N8G3_9PLEO|nr:Di-copper centre-containing protein [Didymosphaeria enalia]